VSVDPLPHAGLLSADRRRRERGATTLPEVIQEMLLTTTSERQGRAIDHDAGGSMEKKKQEGYF
jgi:3'-phosphoadenosine 5'-phosphosulfate sulfotransferase (PAPS reductase)/FAD synthetase